MQLKNSFQENRELLWQPNITLVETWACDEISESEGQFVNSAAFDILVRSIESVVHLDSA